MVVGALGWCNAVIPKRDENLNFVKHVPLVNDRNIGLLSAYAVLSVGSYN